MRNRVPVPAAKRPPIPDPSAALGTGFAPVPRKVCHDGCPFDKLRTERQKAFIEGWRVGHSPGMARDRSGDDPIRSPVDCNSVTRRPMAMVNRAQAKSSTLRRAPGAGRAHGQRDHWDHSPLAVLRLTDVALGAAPPAAQPSAWRAQR